MIVKVKATTVQEMDIDHCEAFRILCQTLDMNCAALDSTSMFTKENEYGELGVYYKVQDRNELFDDRGELFEALRNLAKLLG